jgi:cysteine desulfurase
VSPEFVEGEGVLLMLDARGIAVASGTSCVSKSLKASHVLTGLGVGHSMGLAAILLTLGEGNTDADIDYTLETLPRVVSKLRDMSPTWAEFQSGAIPSSIEPAQTSVSARS